MTGGNAPDGVSEMFQSRKERKQRRRPRQIPPPQHPRPPREPLTGGEEVKPAEQPTDTGSRQDDSGPTGAASPAASGRAAKAAADAALSWSAAWRKQSERLQTLAAAVRRAHEQGAPPLVLAAALADAEQRAGVALPAEVWAAADPEQG